MSNAEEAVEAAPSKKPQLMMIVVALVAVLGSGGGMWYYMQMQLNEVLEEAAPKKIPTTFLELEVFTVNLHPEENNQYLQIGLTVKVADTIEIEEEITKQMPAIRNRILILLSSKTASEISSIDGKQQLSEEITHAIRQSLDAEELHEEVIDVLFTSFVIQ